MLAIQILFWLGIILFVLGLFFDACSNNGDAFVSFGLLMVFIFSMLWLANTDNDGSKRNLSERDHCIETCKGQYHFDYTGCKCLGETKSEEE